MVLGEEIESNRVARFRVRDGREECESTVHVTDVHRVVHCVCRGGWGSLSGCCKSLLLEGIEGLRLGFHGNHHLEAAMVIDPSAPIAIARVRTHRKRSMDVRVN